MHTTPDRIFYFEKVKLLNFGVNFFFEITKLSILTKVKISDCYGFQTFFFMQYDWSIQKVLPVVYLK